MKPVLKILIFIFLFLNIFLLLSAKNTFALSTGTVTPTNPDGDTTRIDENTASLSAQFSGVSPSTPYSVCLRGLGVCQVATSTPDVNSTVTVNNICGDSTELKFVGGGCADSDFFWSGNHTIRLTDVGDNGTTPTFGEVDFTIARFTPQFEITSDNGFKPGSKIYAQINGSRRPQSSTISQGSCRNSYKVVINGSPNPSNNSQSISGSTLAESGFDTIVFISLNLIQGNYTAKLIGQCHDSIKDFTFVTRNITIDPNGGSVDDGGGGGGGLGSGKNPCVGNICETALGPIPTTLKGFSSRILSVAVGLAGGIAFILMVIGAIRILTSQGDPKGVAGGREMLVAAVAGLLFLIFSVILLRFIGINLLGGVAGL